MSDDLGNKFSRASGLPKLTSSCASSKDTTDSNVRNAKSPNNTNSINNKRQDKVQRHQPASCKSQNERLQVKLLRVPNQNFRQKVIHDCVTQARRGSLKSIPKFVRDRAPIKHVVCPQDQRNLNSPPQLPVFLKTKPEFAAPRVKEGTRCKIKRQHPKVQKGEKCGPVYVKNCPYFAEPRVKEGTRLKIKRNFVPSAQFLEHHPQKEQSHADRNMGNIFCGTKQKYPDTDEENSDVWVRRVDLDKQRPKPKKLKKKKEKNHEDSPKTYPKKDYEDNSLSRSECSHKLDSKRYAMYEPPGDRDKITVSMAPVQYRTKHKVETSEVRKSIGDPMDFRMADDLSLASTATPTCITPEPTTPTSGDPSAAPVYRRIQFGKKTPCHSAPVTPKGRRAASRQKDKQVSDHPPPSPRLKQERKLYREQVPKSTRSETSTPQLASKPITRNYILPSPPTRPKFREGGAIVGSPNIVRKYDPKPPNTDSGCVDAISVRLDKLRLLKQQDTHCGSEPVKLRIKPSQIASVDQSAQMLDENEINMQREQQRMRLNEIEHEKLEECKIIGETVIDKVIPKRIESKQHEIVSGPKVAILSTIRPPEKAILSVVPPPSPTAMDALCEEEEEVEEEDEIEEFYDDDDDDNYSVDRRSREVEEFGDQICQRLSQLLEGDDFSLDGIEQHNLEVEKSPLNPGSPGVLLRSGNSSLLRRSTDNSDSEFRISPMLRESELILKEIPEMVHSVQYEKQQPQSTSIDRTSIIIKSPVGSETSDMDNNNYLENTTQDRPKREVYKLQRQETETESDLASSDLSSSFYSESEYSDEEDARPCADASTYYDEGKVYAVPWDLRKRQFSRDSYTSIELSDNFEERVIYARPWTSGAISDSTERINHCDRQTTKVPKSNTFDTAAALTNAQKQCVFQSVEEPPIKPKSIERDFELPKKFSHESEDEVIEETIRPLSIHEDQNIPIEFKRESDILCDVIGSYADNNKINSGTASAPDDALFSPETAAVSSGATTKLDKSLFKIFKSFQDDDDVEEDATYNELAPLQSLIQTAEEWDGGLSEEAPKLRLSEQPKFAKWAYGSRRSLSTNSYTESDIDMSDTGMDGISEDMDADDEEDDGVYDEVMDNEKNMRLLNSKILRQRQNALLMSERVQNTAACMTESDNDSVFLEDDDGVSPRVRRDKRWLLDSCDIPPPPATDFDHEQTSRMHLTLPVSPAFQSSPPYSNSPQSPPNSLDLATTYRAISPKGPKNNVVEVAFDDACQQMNDIHEQLQNLKHQMNRFEGDDSAPHSSRSRHTGAYSRGGATD